METALGIGLANAAVAALLALIMAAAALLWRRPALTHALGVLVLVKLLTPPMFGVPVARWFAKAPRTQAAVTSVQHVVNYSVAPTESNQIITEPIGPSEEWIPPVLPADQGKQFHASLTTTIPQSQFQNAPAMEKPTETHWFLEWLKQSLLLIAGLICLIGSIICASLIVFRIVRFQRLLRFAELAPPELQSRAMALAKRMDLDRAPRVWFVPGAVCPMLWAVGKSSRLLVPSDLWDRLSERQRSSLLAHELAHLKRRDHWVRWIEVAASVLYWWCPVLWYARRRLREAEEQCCDAWVVWAIPGAGRDYASALLEAVEFVTAGGMGMRRVRSMPALASGMGQFHQLKRRLTMIKHEGVSKNLSRSGWAMVCALALGVLPLTPTRAQTPTAAASAKPEASASAAPGAAAAPGEAPVPGAPAAEDRTPATIAPADASNPNVLPPAPLPPLIESVRAPSINIHDPLPPDGKLAVDAEAKIAAEREAVRAEVRELSMALDRAQRRLAALDAATAKENYKRFANKPGSGSIPPEAGGGPMPAPTPKFKNFDGQYKESRQSSFMPKTTAAIPGMSDPQNRERRLEEIEKNLRMLLDEVHSLKKEKATQKPAAGSANDSGYSTERAR